MNLDRCPSHGVWFAAVTKRAKKFASHAAPEPGCGLLEKLGKRFGA